MHDDQMNVKINKIKNNCDKSNNSMNLRSSVGAFTGRMRDSFKEFDDRIYERDVTELTDNKSKWKELKENFTKNIYNQEYDPKESKVFRESLIRKDNSNNNQNYDKNKR